MAESLRRRQKMKKTVCTFKQTCILVLWMHTHKQICKCICVERMRVHTKAQTGCTAHAEQLYY